MREAMLHAEVGDEQRRGDPTTLRLEARVAELLGKEAAVFLPSGAMCNQISFAVHCRAGDEIIMDRTAHPLNYEAGGPSALVGAVIRPLDGDRGVFTAGQVEEAIRPAGYEMPKTRVVSIEQTTNIRGGVCWTMAAVSAVAEVARRHHLVMHMDGARLLNAVVATGVSATEFAAPFDSTWVDFSKGLGAPVGAALAGSRDFIEAAWVWKHRLGGAMRQSGILAAAALYALDNNVERLAEDHANAGRFANGIAGLPGINLDPATVETNIVVFDVSGTGRSAKEFAERALAEHGVQFSTVGESLVRAVTHLDVDANGIDQAITAVARM